MNPKKCAFCVLAGQFLGFMVHERGIEIGQKSIGAINKVIALENKKQLHLLIGKIKLIRMFIYNLSGRV
jgi:hypothetical protein